MKLDILNNIFQNTKIMNNATKRLNIYCNIYSYILSLVESEVPFGIFISESKKGELEPSVCA